MIVRNLLPLVQDAAFHRLLGVAEVGAAKIQRHRVEGSEHSHVGNDGHVVFRVAVAERRHVHNDADVEMRPSPQNRRCVFGDFVV